VNAKIGLYYWTGTVGEKSVELRRPMGTPGIKVPKRLLGGERDLLLPRLAKHVPVKMEIGCW